VSPTSDADFDAALRDLLDDPDNGPEGPSQNTSG